MATTSSFTEGASVFGGQANILEAITNIFALYDPEIIAVHTTCLSETIGDDLNQIIKKAYQEGKTVDDNLKTAPVASKRKDAIHKGIEFSLRLLVAVILIILIMHLIHRHELEKRRKNRISRRKKK